ncbi:MAG TPA: diacylglycerol kinase family protein [Ferruginibacter sp.]|nr:diacylglycerol kinase family protein [Ferruginibacter sp.]
MLALFTNPIAGKGHALKSAATVQTLLQAKGIPYQLFEAPWPAELEGISEAWIIGGDGTLNYFINQYRNIKIPMAIIPGGTGDDFAWHLYGDRSLESLIDYLCTAATPTPIDAGSCNEKFFLNSVGIGFDGEVLKSMSAIRAWGGHLGYLWVVIKQIFRFSEYSFTITVANKRMQSRYLLVNIANAPRTGGGFMVSPLANSKDGALNLMTCSVLSVWKRLRYLPVIEKGKHLSLPFIEHRQLQTVTIETDRPSFAQLDGELIEARRYEIQVYPGRFLFRC